MTTSKDIARDFGYLTDSEIDAIKAATNLLYIEYPIFVNIGAGSGTSTLAISEARPDAMLFSVDVSPGGPLGGLSNEVSAFRRANIETPYQILGDSREVGKNWNREEIDFIFIDDGHGHDEILGDINAWYPNMAENGIMMFHDYGSNDWPAVKDVVDKTIGAFTEPIISVDTVVAYKVKRGWSWSI